MRTPNLEDAEDALRVRLDALPPAARAELLRVLMLPDLNRASAIGDYYNPTTKQFAELLIDAEEDRSVRALLVGMLRETRQDS